MKRFEGKVILVTGAASGIGEAAAYRLAEEGGSIFCTDINEPALKTVTETIASRGGTAKARRLDISSESDVNACVAD